MSKAVAVLFAVTLNLTEAQLRALPDFLAGKTAPGKTAPKKGKQAEEEEEENYGAEEEEGAEGEEEEYNFEEEEGAEGEEEGAEGEEEPEIEEEEEQAPKTTKKAPGKGTTAGKSSTTTGKVKLEDVTAACKATHTALFKKLKNNEKVQAKINAVIKKHGAASVRKLDPKKWSLVIKEVKALAASK